MTTTAKKSSITAALALLALTSAAHASILPADSVPSAGPPAILGSGSEALLSVVRVSDSASITQDLGAQMNQIQSGNLFGLSAGVQSFISNAGGLGSVSFAVIAGYSTGREYMTTSANADATSLEIANSERNVWAGTVNNLIGTLNSGDASASNVNNSYGPFTTAQDGNYIQPGFDLWNGSYVVNTGPGNADLFLYRVLYGTNNLANATISTFFADPVNSFARLSATQLQIGGSGSEVPAPGAAWLMVTALLGLGHRIRRRSTAKL